MSSRRETTAGLLRLYGGIWTNRPFPRSLKRVSFPCEDKWEGVVVCGGLLFTRRWEVQFLVSRSESRRGQVCTSFLKASDTHKLVYNLPLVIRVFTHVFIHAQNKELAVNRDLTRNRKRITYTAIFAFNHWYWCLCCSCMVKSDSFLRAGDNNKSCLQKQSVTMTGN